MSLPVGTVAVVFAVVALGGLVTGINGFGFAVVGTALLATVFEPQTAVVVMILPILAANVSLVRELDRESLSTCVRRFWPYLGAALVGTVVGMAFLSVVPTGPLTLALGVFVLVYVAVSQPWVSIPGPSWLGDSWFTDGPVMKALLGGVSGFVFGVSNVGVQVVAYVRRFNLERSTFVGVLALVFLGISSVRVAIAASFGLFGSTDVALLSAVSAVPGLAGVSVGRWARSRIPISVQEAGTVGLLLLIGVRLLSRGLGL